MKLKRWSQNLLAVTAVTGTGIGLVSCGQSNTADYLYATSAKNNPGQINVYDVDSESGALTQIQDSPYPVGRNPSSLVIDQAGLSLYVANRDDNTVEQINIGSDAKLYGQHTVNPPGSEPVSLAVQTYNIKDQNGITQTSIFLFVVENLQANYTDLNPGPGALFVYNVSGGGTLSGSPVNQTVNGVAQNFFPLGNTPTAVNVTADGNHVYVTDILSSGQTCTGSSAGSTSATGAIQGYRMQFDPTTHQPLGTLVSTSGSPYCAGTTPSAITSHPYGTFLYATDSTQNQVLSYYIDTSVDINGNPTATNGSISPQPTVPVATGTTPDGITVDPRGLYVYVSNKNGQSVSGYGVNLGTGQLSSLATGGSASVGTQPSCLVVEPALGRFLFTANFESGDVSGLTIDPSTGALAGTQNSPYNTAGLTTCVAATVHGNHPTIHVQNNSGS